MGRGGRDTAKSLEGIGPEVVKRLRERRGEIVGAIYHHIQESVPDPNSGQDATYQAGLLTAVNEVFDYCLEAMEGGLGWSGPIPSEARAQARRAAAVGVSLGTVLRRYVAGHSRLGKFVEEEAERIRLSTNGSALHHLRKAQELLLERLTEAIEQEYVQERERIESPTELRRIEIVKRLLGGEPVQSDELTEIGYKINTAWHVGVIAIGDWVEAALRRAKAELVCDLLLVSGDDETTRAWFGLPKPFDITNVERTLSSQGHAGGPIAIGGVGPGLDGWRQTHREAQGAWLRALRRPENVVRYADRPLLAAALESEPLARWLIAFLAPIQGRPDGGVALLETLRAYLDAECNCSSAASALKVRRQTVGNRLRQAEALLGRPLRSCLAELDVALRLVDLTPSAPRAS